MGMTGNFNGPGPYVVDIPPPVSGGGISSRVSLASKGAQSGRTVEDVVTTAGSDQISSATAAFDRYDLGSLFTLCDPADFTRVVNGTIVEVLSATTCRLSATVSYSATGVGMALGRDNTQAIADAIAALSVSQRMSSLFVPEGVFLTTAGFRTLDGQHIIGPSEGKTYGKATMPVGAGSAILLASNIATANAAFFQLGNFTGSASSGRTGSVMEGVVIDACNNADRAVWTRCRRARMRHAAVWRGRLATLFVSAQNSGYSDVTIAGHNTGNVVHVDGSNAADVQFEGGKSEFRQGGAAAFNASTGHQLYIENPSNVQVVGVHMYSGEFSVVSAAAQGANIMVRKTDGTAGGGVLVANCEMDGTYGPKMHVRNEGSSRLHGIQFMDNTCLSLPNELSNRFGMVEVAPISGSIRGLNVDGNWIVHNGGGRDLRAFLAYQNIDGTTTGLAGTMSLTSVRNNQGLGVLAAYSGITPDQVGGNCWSTSAATTTVVKD